MIKVICDKCKKDTNPNNYFYIKAELLNDKELSGYPSTTEVWEGHYCEKCAKKIMKDSNIFLKWAMTKRGKINEK